MGVSVPGGDATDGPLQSQLKAGARLRRLGARGRYAPSPTGAQHLGNARTALLAWLQARLEGGVFILRLEDLDTPRVREGVAERIVEELAWLGIDWDEGVGVGGASAPYAQSRRDDLYAAAMETLASKGLAYECYCSRRDIRLAASAPHGRMPPYPGTCRDKRRRDAGRPAAVRFRVPEGVVSFEDRVAGWGSQDVPGEVGDFVLRRSDGIFAYQLAVVVDDALMGVSDVVRGMDLIDSTPRQLLLYEALGVAPPRFWHVPLMYVHEGQKMSKGSAARTTIDAFRRGGGTPRRLVGELAATVGLVAPGEQLTATELLERYDVDAFVDVLRAASAG